MNRTVLLAAGILALLLNLLLYGHQTQPMPLSLFSVSAQAGSDDKELERLSECGHVLQEILGTPDNIPQELLNKAACVIVIPSEKVKKLAIIGARGSSRGAMSCRTGNDFTGSWSAPAMYRLEGGSGGRGRGDWTDMVPEPRQATDFVLLVMNPKGADAILKGKAKLGVDATVAAGPKGPTAPQIPSEVLGYSRSGGVFAGVMLEAAILRQDSGTNKKVYGREVTARDIVRGGAVPMPAAAQLMISTLSTHSPGN